MFGHILRFSSRRSSASPPPAFKSENATTKLPSKLTKKLQALKQALKPCRSGTKGDGQATYGAKQETDKPTSYESGNLARCARSLLNRRRGDLSSSSASGLLPAGTKSTTRSAARHSNFSGVLNAPPTPLGPNVQAPSRAPPPLQGLVMPSDSEPEYPAARKRVREIRAMKAGLRCDEVQGIKTTYHVQVLAPRTTTTFPSPSWDVNALEYANEKCTMVAKFHENGSRVHEERNLLNAPGIYHTRRFSSHENPTRALVPDPSLWLGDNLSNGPAYSQNPVRNRSPLLDAATVPVGQELYERLNRSRNLSSSRH
ncbi:hypothetical protein FS837_009844 [Tulasnella sp. UAMH 9824]|nr:hypothetical protein FS837_009844 [Tulasnella sp. UAMH 9824]